MRPYEIDRLTLAQIYLYFADGDTGIDKARTSVRDYWLKRLKDRFDKAGRLLPEDFEELPNEKLKELWDSIPGE